MSNSLAITVSEKNIAKIERAITEAEGRATARLATYSTVTRAVAAAEKRLAVLPKKMWDGATCTYDDTAVPNSYGRGAESTAVTVQRKGTRWVFVGAKRVPTKQGSYGTVSPTSFARVTLAEMDVLGLLDALLGKAGLNLAASTRERMATVGV